MGESRKQRTVLSSLWSAYGDVLGFPTEMATPSMITQRIGSSVSTRPVSWRRLVGGRFGAHAQLGAGSYSDDTQLRLATSRAIRGDGFFDVEAFAKIELPVWLAYSLGAGRGSKAAANSLSNRGTNWFSNFFSTNETNYVNGGGNGAAMRIQPHVWCAEDLQNERSFLTDVVRNAVCTHGHVRAIAGAMIHAATLAYVLRTEKLPSPNQWMDFAHVVEALPSIVSEDDDLRTFWLPTWEKLCGKSLDDAVIDVADEWAHCVGVAVSLLNDDPERSYCAVVESLDGLSNSERGSGLKCTLFSLVAASTLRPLGTPKAIEVIVNLLQSDTDTIATMAGALLGALPGQIPPDGEIQDREYLEKEAERLFAISQRKAGLSFAYPDLLYWQSPKTPLDSVGTTADRLALAGLGSLVPLGDNFPSNQKDSVWQWFRLDFGQTVLCKLRIAPKSLPPSALPDELRPAQKTPPVRKQQMSARPKSEPTPDMFTPASASPPETIERPSKLVLDQTGDRPSMNQLTDVAIRSNFDPAIIGRQLLDFAEDENCLELAIGYAAIVVKARRARIKRG